MSQDDRTEWAEIFGEHLCQKYLSQRKISTARGRQAWGRGPKQQHFSAIAQMFELLKPNLQDIVVLWSKSSTLDREIRGSNLGGTQKWKTTNFFILSNRREETQKDDAEDIESSRIGSR